MYINDASILQKTRTSRTTSLCSTNFQTRPSYKNSVKRIKFLFLFVHRIDQLLYSTGTYDPHQILHYYLTKIEPQRDVYHFARQSNTSKRKAVNVPTHREPADGSLQSKAAIPYPPRGKPYLSGVSRLTCDMSLSRHKILLQWQNPEHPPFYRTETPANYPQEQTAHYAAKTGF